MKTITKNNLRVDVMARARKHPSFKQYSQEARARILLAVEIYRARTNKGLSQQELAKKAQTTQKVISKVENGQVNVGFDLVFKIVHALGLKLQLGRTFLI